MSHYATESSAYRIAITASGLGGSAPADGFIDNTKMEAYLAAGGTAPNLVQTLAKKRGNLRYRTIVMSTTQDFNYRIDSVSNTGGGSTATPSAFQFEITIERGNSVLFTADEDNAGVNLTGAAALRRIFARALLVAITTRCEYIDPTASTIPAGTQDNAEATGQRRGNTIADVVVGALTSSLATAESKVTITAL